VTKAIRKEGIRWKELKIPLIKSIILLLSLSLVLIINYFYTEFLWFKEVGYVEIFYKRYLTSFIMFFGSVLFSLLFAYLWTKFFKRKFYSLENLNISSLGIFWVLFAGGICLSFYLASYWLTILRWLYQTPFGINEPIFHHDLSFYVFTLPVHKLLSSYLLYYILAAGIILFLSWFILYNKLPFLPWILSKSEDEMTKIKEKRKEFYSKTSSVLTIFLILLSAVLIWKTRISIWKILYSPRGVVFGAGFTDVHAQIIAYWIFIFLLMVGILALIIFMRKKSIKTIGIISGGVLGAWLLVCIIFPALIQYLVVKPNELAKEKPYIKYNIEFTRQAYNLIQVEEKDFEAVPIIPKETLFKYSSTLNNIRLWDWGALKDTYRQRQLIRLYYEFHDVNIDRYMINGNYRQVMLSLRELDRNKFPEKARTWINDKLKYTHGYGLCLSPVNEFGPGGIPNFLIKDIPPVSTSKSLAVTRPEIYYGELTQDYVIVNTSEEEFDYPKGEENVYCQYRGEGGIKLSLVNRFCFAIRFNDIRILISGAISSLSKLLWRRNIVERASQIFPFLYDEDPYPVIRVDGTICYILDAYTTTDAYPYSEPYEYTLSGRQFIPEIFKKELKKIKKKSKNINYIRNSVKIVIDTYNGKVTFYVFDEQDPIMKTYMKIFPKAFSKTKRDMPEDLRRHVRYPESLLRIQSAIYSTYHMTDYRVFYNKEDQWKIASEVYINTPRPVEPYYVIIQLPGESKEEFLLMLPFTPLIRDNMIAWLAGRCDEPNYGKLIVYRLPKEKMVYGPLQIEARVDQKPEMSEKITLWGQRGSTIIRGNLLVIPIENSLLYVEPIFLKAEAAQLPEIKRILVAMGDNIQWAEDLYQAIDKIYAQLSEEIKPEVKLKEKPKKELIKETISQIEELLKKLKNAIREMED
jgi:uncharacterized membrane protein (UPF0182 family)